MPDPSPTRLFLDLPIHGAITLRTLDPPSRQWLLPPLARLTGALRHTPPRPDEMETAIADVEDTIMPLIAQWPSPRRLSSSSPLLQRIAEIAGASPEQTALATDTVEALFNRAVDVANGLPARHAGMPEDTSFVAGLLLLRELLHHAGLKAIDLDPARIQP